MATPSAYTRIYTVNGPSSTSSSSLPQWLTTKVRQKGFTRKRTKKTTTLGQLELIQDFTFPQSAIKIKTTADGNYVVGTGTYKPMMKVWDLRELTVKFERVTEAENVDFVMLSEDWTKSLHLQGDRSLGLHSQGGLHHTLRLPTYGRCLAYHSPSAEALVGCTGRTLYRFNMEEGRYMQPITISNPSSSIDGVNCIDVNQRHGLWSFGLDGASKNHIEFWDPRSRSALTALHLPVSSLLPSSGTGSMSNAFNAPTTVNITSLKSHPTDGLSLAVGTSTGHTLLYDIRSPRAFAVKDQGYGEAIKGVEFLLGGGVGGEDKGEIMSADSKVVKVWDKNDPSSNHFSLHPPAPLLSMHPISHTGLLLLATDSPTLSTYYIPELGPAPKWASFLDGVTEELEDEDVGGANGVEGKGAYRDYKFVDKTELEALGLSHLIGTSTLKPYMHGYFLSLSLYSTARLISQPQSYTSHRENMVTAKIAAQAESRIRAKREQPKVNKGLAERVRKNEEREEAKERKKRERLGRKDKAEEAGDEDEEVEEEVVEEDGKDGKKRKSENILQDPRFKELWTNPEFEVDEESREFSMLNPATANNNAKRRKTAVEEEAEESDRQSSDGISGSESEEESEHDDDDDSEDSDDAGDLRQYDPRDWKASERPTKGASLSRVGQSKPRMVIGEGESDSLGRPRPANSFGARLRDDRNQESQYGRNARNGKGKNAMDEGVLGMRKTKDGGMEMSFMPKVGGGRGDDDLAGPDYKLEKKDKNMEDEKKGGRKKEAFGAGLEKGGFRGLAGGEKELSEAERKGRSSKRNPGRSASKNVFRGMQ